MHNREMKILLVNPFSTFKIGRTEFKFPNTGLASVYATLRHHDIEADLCDLQILPEPDLAELDVYLRNRVYDAVGITTVIDTLENVSDIVTWVTKTNKDIPIIIGGPPVTYQPELWLEETNADIAVIGECELTLPELLSRIQSDSSLANTNGICLRSSDRILRTKPRRLPANLDYVPFPDYSLYDLESYFRNPYSGWLFGEKRCLNLMSSRGCPFRCAFCCNGAEMRTHPISRIIKETEQLVKRFNLEKVFIRDDVFTIDQRRALAITKELGKLDISWMCMTRSDLLCREGDAELTKLMKESGCETLMVGVESYDQEVLRKSNKHLRLSQIDKAMENCEKAAFRTIAFMMFGLPGETEESIKRSLDFIERSGVEVNSNILQPLPGSKIYDDAIKQGKIRDEVKYLKDFHFFWDAEGYLPVNMTDLPDDLIIWANLEASKKNELHKYKTDKKKRRMVNE